LKLREQQGYFYKPQDASSSGLGGNAAVSSYNVPQSSVGAPAFGGNGGNTGFGGSAGNGNTGFGGSAGSGNSEFGGSPGSGNTGFSGSAGSGNTGLGGSAGSGGNGGGNNGGDSQNIGQILFQGSTQGIAQSRPSVQVVQGEPIVHKHFYVHAGK
jgi:hypothetical protein